MAFYDTFRGAIHAFSGTADVICGWNPWLCARGSLLCITISVGCTIELRRLSVPVTELLGRVGVGAELQRLEEEEGILFPTDRSLFRVQKSREGEKQREGSNNTTKCPIA